MSEADKKRPFDPYLVWLGIRDPRRPPHHYRLLGLEIFEDDPEVIQNAADRQISYVRRFLVGERAAEAQQVLQGLIAARACLLDRKAKAAYDAALETELESCRPPAVLHMSPQGGGEAQAPPQELPVPVLWTQLSSVFKRGLEGLFRPLVSREEATGVKKLAEPGEIPASELNGGALPNLVRRYIHTAAILGVVALVLLFGISLLHRLPRLGLAQRGPRGEESTGPGISSPQVGDSSQTVGEERALSPGPTRVLPSLQPEDAGGGKQTDGEVMSGELGQDSSPKPSEAGETPENGPPYPEAGQSGLAASSMTEGPSEKATVESFDSWNPDASPGLKRLPVPEPAEVAVARQQWESRIPDFVASQMNKELGEEGIRKLLEAARSAENLAERYAAMEIAAEWAFRLESAPLLRQVVEEFLGMFQVSRKELLEELFAGSEGRKLSGQFRRDLALLLLVLGGSACDEGDFEDARWCLGMAESFAQQAKDPSLTENVAERAKLLPLAENAYREAREAHRRLQSEANDPQAHTALGVYLCFYRSQPKWSEGLSHLARGADPLLRDLAEAEVQLSPKAPAKEKVALGDRWQKAAEQAPPELRAAFLTRAAYWYHLALPETAGFTRVRLENFLSKLKGSSH